MRVPREADEERQRTLRHDRLLARREVEQQVAQCRRRHLHHLVVTALQDLYRRGAT